MSRTFLHVYPEQQYFFILPLILAWSKSAHMSQLMLRCDSADTDTQRPLRLSDLKLAAYEI